MSYTPTAEKMASLGFEPALCAFKAKRYVNFDLSQKWNGELYCYDTGRVGLIESHSMHNYDRFVGLVPDEDFFDKLLLAVGFRPTPPPPPAHSGQPGAAAGAEEA